MVLMLCVVNFTLVIAIAYIFVRDSETLLFNHGRCPVCGHRLRYFANDWLIGRGYICDKCSYTAWVLVKAVDKKYE